MIIAMCAGTSKSFGIFVGPTTTIAVGTLWGSSSIGVFYWRVIMGISGRGGGFRGVRLVNGGVRLVDAGPPTRTFP